MQQESSDSLPTRTKNSLNPNERMTMRTQLSRPTLTRTLGMLTLAWAWLASGERAATATTAETIDPAQAEVEPDSTTLWYDIRLLNIEGRGWTDTKEFYGTSITQGGCASRPGMVHTAILGRRLNRPVINLGFSGNGKMEPEMAALFAQLDPAVYVLDCLPNMRASEVLERVEPFVATLRNAHPTTPILLVEDRDYSNAFLVPTRRERNTKNHRALRKVYESLQSAGVQHLHYLPGDRLLGDDGESTVDGSHPTDLGFMRQAEAFQKALTPMLQSR